MAGGAPFRELLAEDPDVAPCSTPPPRRCFDLKRALAARVRRAFDALDASDAGASVSTPQDGALPHLYSGKVRELYEVGHDRLLMVASDRVSVFDVVLPDEIPDKGRVLTGLSHFWFDRTRHRAQPRDLGRPDRLPRRRRATSRPGGRSCGRLDRSGSSAWSAAISSVGGWEEYEDSGTVGGFRGAVRSPARPSACPSRCSRRRPRPSPATTCR